MSTKAPSTPDIEQTATGRATEDTVLLRDESDEIIDNLKAQLAALRGQVNRLEADGGQDDVARARRFESGMAPHIASRLSIPAGELTERLERIIADVNDDSLRAELEQCRDTAFFLFDTFQHITDRHQDLTDSLSARDELLAMDAFVRQMEDALHARNLPLTVEADKALPGELRVSARSVVTVLSTLADLTGEIFAKPQKVALTHHTGEDGAGIELVLDSMQAKAGLENEQEITSGVIRSGVRSRAVVDLLYVEKIIEMRGGRLSFFRVDGMARGFRVFLPFAPLEDATQPSGA